MAMTMSVRVMSMRVVAVGIAFVLSKEREEPHAEHVERCDESCDHSHKPVNPILLVGLPQNFIFAEEPGKRRDSSDGDRASGHGPECPWNLRPQATHLAHVLLAAHGVNY